MTILKILANILLIGIIFFLARFLVNDIKGPISYEQQRKKRYEATKDRLKEIRTAQLMFKKNNGKFMKDIDSLIAFVLNDSIEVQKVIGDPNDSLVVSTTITKNYKVIDTMFNGNVTAAKNLAFIPYSDGVKFDSDAGFIEKNRVNVAVFEVSAAFEHMYNGLNKQYFDPKKRMIVGSMSEPKTAGNWE